MMTFDHRQAAISQNTFAANLAEGTVVIAPQALEGAYHHL
jgi:hypothetical protein